MHIAIEVNKELDIDRVTVVEQEPQNADTNNGDIRILLTGRAASVKSLLQIYRSAFVKISFALSFAGVNQTSSLWYACGTV